MDGSISVFIIVCLFAISVVIYFLPAIIGKNRGINSSGALFFVNLISGWTLIGWLICFLWATTGATRAQTRSTLVGPHPRARLDHLAADIMTFGATLVPVRDLTLSQAWRSSPMARQDRWLPV